MENETMKVRLKGLNTAANLYYPTLKMEIKFNESGVAEVPIHIGKKLLSSEYSGYEEIGVTSGEISKPTRSSKGNVAPKKEEEFLEQLKV